MDPIEKLGTLFERFPGIGPRQAQRFVQHLLRSSPTYRRDLMEAVRALSSSVHQCPSCKRFHTGAKGPCTYCTSDSRDNALLAVVASDADLLALERSHTFSGRYFVLGGLISLASENTQGLRINELRESLKERKSAGLSEIILAFPANPEGDSTAIRVREELLPAAEENGIRISTLGRGLSTGSELEYADPDTLRSALANRK